jgi:hypothetical protein
MVRLISSTTSRISIAAVWKRDSTGEASTTSGF